MSLRVEGDGGIYWRRVPRRDRHVERRGGNEQVRASVWSEAVGYEAEFGKPRHTNGGRTATRELGTIIRIAYSCDGVYGGIGRRGVAETNHAGNYAAEADGQFAS